VLPQSEATGSRPNCHCTPGNYNRRATSSNGRNQKYATPKM